MRNQPFYSTVSETELRSPLILERDTPAVLPSTPRLRVQTETAPDPVIRRRDRLNGSRRENPGETPAVRPPGDTVATKDNRIQPMTAPFTRSFFVGLRWPGVSVGFHDPPYTLEFKYLDDSPEVTITGVRMYNHFLPFKEQNYYWGVDMARVEFQGDVSRGKGTSTGLFFGFHRRLTGFLSWRLDLGPYYIYLKDDPTGVPADGLEYTVTTGINVELW